MQERTDISHSHSSSRAYLTSQVSVYNLLKCNISCMELDNTSVLEIEMVTSGRD